MDVVSVALRRGTSAEWASTVLVLQIGELAFDIEKRHLKTGDGVSLWPDLPVMFDLSHMPISAVDVYVDISEASMLAREVSVGDISLRTDISRTFVYGGEALGGWVEMEVPTGSGVSVPTGPAGGVLSGSYPDPGFAEPMATQAELEAVQGALADLQSGINDYLTEPELPGALAAITSAVVGTSTALLGFYGVAPVAKQAALTPATGMNVSLVSVLGIEVLGGGTSNVVNNHTTRINEIEARLRAYGLLP